MFDENQLVTVKWNNTNRERYEQLGYVYTKRYDSFQVKAKDLPDGSDARIKVICDYCGKEFISRYCTVKNGRNKIDKDACYDCHGTKASEVSIITKRKERITALRKLCEDNGYTLLTTEDEYTDVKMRIRYICPIHGERSTIYDNFMKHPKCLKCSQSEIGIPKRKSIEYIKYTIEKDGNVWLNDDEYTTTTRRNLRIKCSCGNEFITSFTNYERNNVNHCFSCSCKESSGERIIRDFLDDNNIVYIQEKRFDDCRDKKPLPFDFYLPDKNVIIEFDGIQHFKEVETMDHKTTKRHDGIKNKYCDSNHIDLIRIPYWDGNNISSILSEKLCL